MATCDHFQSFTVWDASTGRQTHSFRGYLIPVLAAPFSPDGSLVASASGDGNIRLWNLSIAELPRVDVFVNCVALSPQETIFVIHSRIRTIEARTVDSNKLVWTQPETVSANGSVQYLLMSPDGKFLAQYGSQNADISILHLGSGQRYARFERTAEKSVKHLSFRSDSRQVVLWTKGTKFSPGTWTTAPVDGNPRCRVGLLSLVSHFHHRAI